MQRGGKGPGSPGAPGTGSRGPGSPRPGGDAAAVTYQRGRDLHRAGNLTEAGKRYREVLALNPRHGDALHALGMVLHQLDRHEPAEQLLRRAVEAMPSNPAFHASLGMVQATMGRPADAAKSFRAALRRDPDSAQLNANLGTALLALGQAEEAAQAHRRALRQRPEMARAHAGLGRALAAMARLGEAEASLRRAVDLAPDYVDAQVWLGEVLLRDGRIEDAAASFSAAAMAQPEHVAAHLGLAAALAALGRHEGAANNFRAAAYLAPTSEAHFGLGQALQALGRHDEATEAFHTARRLSPADDAIAAALADHLARLGQPVDLAAPARAMSELERQVERYRMAVAVTPGNAVALANLGSALATLGQLEESIVYNRRALEADPGYFPAWSSLIFAINYLGDLPVSAMVAEARRFGSALAAAFPARTGHANPADPDRRLNVGLVSADLRTHPVGMFLDATLAALDPGRIQLFAYSDTRHPDDPTTSLKASVPNWRDTIDLDDAAVEQLILADRIDILIDLAGHTGSSRLPLFARKPAPLAVTWLGYFATTGLAAIDYVLATPWVIPTEEQSQWVEKPWHLPETYLCYTPPRLRIPVAPPPMLANGYVTFGSANNINKLNAGTAACWAGVLTAVPGSKLLLRSKALDDIAVQEKAIAMFAAAGIAADRLILQGGASYDVHLARYGDVDMALDPFPYAGGTTTMESLWMGVPVLTLRGDRYVAHMGENILHNLGMADWIASDPADYATRAAAFAADPQALTGLRQSLRPRVAASPLCDAPRFARALEQALRGMWETWCREHR